MRGRRPDPEGVASQKAAVRSVRRGPVAASAPSVSGSSAVRAPAWLKGEGLAIWKRVSPRMAEAKLLTSADAEAFARYCRNLALWVKLRGELDGTGYTYESDSNHGKLRRVDPAFLIADRVERQLLAAEDRFGMNPSERQRIFVARANTGVSGDLFDRAPSDPAAKSSPPAAPIDSPIGLLN